MKKKNEITAMKASGLNIITLSQPLIIVSFFIGIGVFLLSEFIVPYTSSRSNEIWEIEVEKKDPTRFYGSNQIWYRGSNSIYWIKHFDYEKRMMEDLTFYFFDDDFRLLKKIDGRKAVWEAGQWKIVEGVIQEAKNDGSYTLNKIEEFYLKLPETPDTFVRRTKNPEELSYWQLKLYAEKVRLEGYDDTRYLVDMNIKIAYPLISLILVLSGIPIALGINKGGTPFSVSIGIGICFLYMLTLGSARSLGLSGVLPPILSAWISNMFFALFGIYLMMNVER